MSIHPTHAPWRPLRPRLPDASSGWRPSHTARITCLPVRPQPEATGPASLTLADRLLGRLADGSAMSVAELANAADTTAARAKHALRALREAGRVEVVDSRSGRERRYRRTDSVARRAEFRGPIAPIAPKTPWR